MEAAGRAEQPDQAGDLRPQFGAPVQLRRWPCARACFCGGQVGSNQTGVPATRHRTHQRVLRVYSEDATAERVIVEERRALQVSDMKIVQLEAHILRAPDIGRPHWVSHFIVPRANEILVRMRTDEGVEGIGLATSYTPVAAPIHAFRSGIAELIIGSDAL